MAACFNAFRALTGGRHSDRQDSDTPEPAPSATQTPPDGEYPFVPPSHIVNGSIWRNHFTEQRELGKGASCRVLHVRGKDGSEYAMKEMKKNDKWNPMLFKQEVRILQEIRGHPNVLQYADCYMDTENFYILTDLCTGGELFDKIKELKHFREDQARDVIKTLLDVLKYCHERNIVHRDLKPENMVYADPEQTKLIIIDFGDAKEVKEDDLHEDFVGTAFYLAPESIRNRRGWELKKSDMWTVGVITYVLVTGRPPFWGRNNKETLRRILRCRINFPTTIKLSYECKNFITSLLKTQPGDRMSAADALLHQWITQERTQTLTIAILKGLARFAGCNKLKKLLVRTVAENLDSQRKNQLQSQFQALDLNGDGRIDAEELTEFLKGNGYEEDDAKEKAQEVIHAIVGPNHRRIALQDWSNASVAKLLSSEHLIQKQYQKLDVDGDHMISSDDLLNIFEGASQNEVQQIIDEVDADQDGCISFQEFKQAMSFQPAFEP